ncbi:hypothetical protein NVP1215B_026 [Vibrio phage 1.215.B._10N.222.54.F7]|nr:hypothetical protein NVP1215A_026 [Vibrio phage 1.215.A._10N.222.54.F7]AUR96049.1 hypothetical protein NVP1215B_026 [Vibrio phage 1.215.B._10N.222.54.F7]
MYERDDKRFNLERVRFVDPGKEDDPREGYTAMTAEFGDGNNRINSAVFEDKVGVLIYRNTELDPGIKLDVKNGDTIEPPKYYQDVIALNFSTVQSIDAVINQLGKAREQLLLLPDVPEHARDPEATKPKSMLGEVEPEEGGLCPDLTCEEGVLNYESHGSCTCHINPPCGYCTDAPLTCSHCGTEYHV